MIGLNLVYPENSDIQFKHQKFPDGQQNIILNPDDLDNYLEGKWIEYKVQIKSRLNNWLDLELITCAVASLRELEVKEIHLYTPYIMGARSDRKFEEGGGNNYLKDVICPIINSLNFKTVTCIDPHSDVLEACIKGFRKNPEPNVFVNLTDFLFHDKYGREWCKGGDNDISNDFVLVSPDAGASKKIYKVAERIGYKGDIITCSKDRNTDGKLTKTIVPVTGEQHNMLHKGPYKDFIIIDDICDGGATFINIAKEIKQYFHESGKTQSKIYLIVTHGIFSKGLKELSKYFDGIYSTNSYSDWDYSDLKAGEKQILKQLNVF